MTAYVPLGPLTYHSKEGCTGVVCTRDIRDNTRCFGWHCSYCDEPCSYQGHDCVVAETILAEARRLSDEAAP